MQNKNKTFPDCELSLRESRLSKFGLTDHFDRQQVRATDEEFGDISGKEKDLKEKLEILKKLERGKRTKNSKKEIARLRKAIEKNKGVDVPDGQVEKMIHELIEKHDKEVGTAIQIKKGNLLVHASESATKLVLQHNNIEGGEEIDSEKIKTFFKAAGFEVDSSIYRKDQIPTARPFSKVTEEGWTVEVPVEKEAENKAVSFPSTESLLKKNGTQKYEKNLEVVYDTLTIEKVENLRDVKSFKGIGKANVGEKYKIIRDGGDHPRLGDKYKYKIVQKIGANGQPEGQEYKLCINDKGSVSGGVPNAVADLFALKKEDLTDPAKMRKLRRASSAEFQESVEESDLSSAEQEELIAVFKVLDVSYGRVANGNSLEREAVLSKQTKNLGGRKVEKLFADKLGFGMKWNVLYYNFSAEKLGKTPEKYKPKVQNILRGGEVFMLRVDQKSHGGKLEARIDQSNGDAWADSIDAPKTLRPKEKYIYKYLEIRGESEKTKILKKYLKKDNVDSNEIANYQIAQVEIPNCENPAIVIKKKPTPVAPKTRTVALSATAVQTFKNVPDGWTRILRIPDWFKNKQQRNYLADPPIVDVRGEKTIRASEYLNARKRLDAKPHKFLAERVDDVLGWWHSENFMRRGVAESLDKYLDAENKKLISAITADLEKRLAVAGDGKGPDSFLKRARAKNDWQKEWTKKGVDERQMQLAELLSDWECKDFSELSEKMTKEEEAFYLADLLKNHSDNLDKNRSDFDDPKLNAILAKYKVNLSLDTKSAVESALYDEDKINAAREPLYIGDAIFIPPTVDKKGEAKITIWENQAEFGKEMLNVHSPLSLTIEVASLLTGYVGYIRTGVGRADALEKYLEDTDGSPEAKQKLAKIFQNQADFDAFRNFIVKGQVPETGGNKISIPINEVQILIPGWKLLADLFAGGKEACPPPNPTIEPDNPTPVPVISP